MVDCYKYQDEYKCLDSEDFKMFTDVQLRYLFNLLDIKTENLSDVVEIAFRSYDVAVKPGSMKECNPNDNI